METCDEHELCLHCSYEENGYLVKPYCNKYKQFLVEKKETDIRTMRDISVIYCCEKCLNENNKSTKINDVKKFDKKEGECMFYNNNDMFGKFGQVEDGSVVLTMSGQIAIRKNNNEYVIYNKDTQTIENQMGMIIKGSSKFIYIVPVNEVNVNDILKIENNYFQVLNINSNQFEVVNIKNGLKETIIKETNIVGMSFYSKVANIFSCFGSEQMSNILPLMGANINTQENNNINPLMLQMFNNQSINPMMLMMMNGKVDMKTLLMLNMMNNR